MNSLVQPPNLGSATGYLHPLSEQLFPNTEEKKKIKEKNTKSFAEGWGGGVGGRRKEERQSTRSRYGH